MSEKAVQGNKLRTVVVLGIPFQDVSFGDVVEWVKQRVKARRPGYIATANMDFIMQAWRDPEQQRILLEADLVVADGIPIVWLSRVMGFGLKERVTGSDLVPRFAELCAREGFSLYGLGGAPGVAEKATAHLVQRYPGLRIAGCYSPPKADVLNMNNAEILVKLEVARPDILLVAFGAPKQEKWVNMHIRQWQVPVSIGIGGSLDFLAGTQKRAPRFIQKCALEWLWRMLSDPPRLFKRYVSNIFFFGVALLKLLLVRYGPSGAPTQAPLSPADCDVLASIRAKRIIFPGLADDGAVAAFCSACAAEAGGNALVIDLEQRPWLTILELGTLVEVSRTCRAQGRKFCILASQPRVAKAFRFYRLEHYLHTAGCLEEILEALRKQQGREEKRVLCRVVNGCLLVTLPTELTVTGLDACRTKVEEAWHQAEQQQLKGVTLDATALEFMDSAALGFLNGIRVRTAQTGLLFKCVGFHGEAVKTLKIARLDSLFLGAQHEAERRA